MKIVAFAGSNSSTSINYQLLKYAVSKMEGFQIQLLNMANYPFPLYSEDLEKENGFSNSLIELNNDITNADALILGVNEHNGNASAYFKNVLDWLSRLDRNFMADKKVLLLSTSPGAGGGKRAIEVIKNMLPHMGAVIIDLYSLPSFYKNFSLENGVISNEILDEELSKVLLNFKTQISK